MINSVSTCPVPPTSRHCRTGLSLLLIGLLAGLSSSCGRFEEFKLPGLKTQPIIQGNLVAKEHFEKLQPGMNRDQVRFTVGSPQLQDPFHRNRWDYLYYRKEQGKEPVYHHIVLFFEDDLLARIDERTPMADLPPDPFKRQEQRSGSTR